MSNNARLLDIRRPADFGLSLLTTPFSFARIENIGKGDEKEEYVWRVKRENCSPAERQFGKADAEGSF